MIPGVYLGSVQRMILIEKSKTKSEREIFNWVYPATKEGALPDELTAALKKNKKLESYFHAFAFSHKKEYIEWIVTAKREDTKTKRIKVIIERLAKRWKNPANR